MRSLKRWVTRLLNSLTGRIDNQRLKEEIEEHIAWPWARSARRCCRQRWGKVLAYGFAAGLLLGILASRLLAFLVYQATPRDPLVWVGVVLAMSLRLLATWIPAQRALSVNPLILLREE